MYRTNDDLEQNMSEQKVTISLSEYKELIQDVAAINAVHRLVLGGGYFTVEDIMRLLCIEPHTKAESVE